MLNMFRNNKGQISETVTWVVATVIVIVVLGISIFVAKAYFSANKTSEVSTFSGADTLATKSLFSYLVTKNPQSQINYNQIKTSQGLSMDNGVLAQGIFTNIYGKEYVSVWFGIFEPAAGNEYFGSRPSPRGSVAPDQSYSSRNILEQIKLNGEKDLQLLLIKDDDVH